MATLTLFSELSLRLMKGGRPLINQEVTQHVEWSGTSFSRTFFTDEHGFIAASEMAVSRLFGRGGQNNPAHQFISTRLGDRNYILWDLVKRDFRRNSELDGLPLALDCDINSAIKTIPTTRSTIKTRCLVQRGTKSSPTEHRNAIQVA